MNNLKIENIMKRFGKKTVLDGACLDVPFGQIVGILGLNGSGKTTLFNCLSGLESNDNEQVYFAKKSDFCYMSKLNFYQYGDKIGDIVDFFDFFFSNFDRVGAEKEIEEYGLKKKSLVRSLSLGQRGLFDFILAMNRTSQVYMFDEPFSNLDVNVREYMKKQFISNIDENKLFLISSHELTELESIFSQVMILQNGKLSPCYDVEQIRERGYSLNEFYKNIVNNSDDVYFKKCVLELSNDDIVNEELDETGDNTHDDSLVMEHKTDVKK